MPKKKNKKREKNQIPIEKYLVYVGILSVLVFFVLIYNSIFTSGVVYKGIVPCADCPGIEETIIFNKNNTYVEKFVYLERNTSYTNKGTWSIIKGGNFDKNTTIYRLVTEDKKNTKNFVLENNQLKPLDPDLNELPFPYNKPLIRN